MHATSVTQFSLIFSPPPDIICLIICQFYRDNFHMKPARFDAVRMEV